MAIASGEMLGTEIRDGMVADMQERVTTLYDEGQIVGLHLLNARPDFVPSRTYVNLKRKLAMQVGIVPAVGTTYTAEQLPQLIAGSNEHPCIAGIVVQLPLRDDETHLQADILNTIMPEKDVDGLRETDEPRLFTPATPTAILRLLEGHGVDVSSAPVAVNGLGKLVGGPLLEALRQGGADVVGIDVDTSAEEKHEALNRAEVIVTATGVPGLLTTENFTSMQPRVLVDAGTAEQGGVIQGDVSDELRRAALANDWLISAKKGGVGPLTVASLLENVVTAAERSAATD